MTKLKVGLFVTCLVDLFRPEIAFACVKLLEDADVEVFAPKQQTCCGQPAYNNGDRSDTKIIARQVIQLFEGYDYVVVPSGSCGGMISRHYPTLFDDDNEMASRANALAKKTYELTAFLVDVLQIKNISQHFPNTVTYHDACSGLRELNIKKQPRALLSQVADIKLNEMQDTEVCCGFGGTFCVKYPDISNKMVSNKVKTIQATDADVLLAGDLGCLMNMAGKLKREGSAIKVMHVAEVLAGMTDTKGVGDPT
jgi:L-lactate dehydrogenase complex protein LldE